MRTLSVFFFVVLFAVSLSFGQSTPVYSPLSTPTLSLQGPALQSGASNATAGLSAGAENQTALPQTAAPTDLYPIYYGPAAGGDVGFGSEGAAAPASPVASHQNFNPGVRQFTTSSDLHERGYGMNVAEVAAYAKAHKRSATRVYTNADIDRLRDRS